MEIIDCREESFNFLSFMRRKVLAGFRDRGYSVDMKPSIPPGTLPGVSIMTPIATFASLAVESTAASVNSILTAWGLAPIAWEARNGSLTADDLGMAVMEAYPNASPSVISDVMAELRASGSNDHRQVVIRDARQAAELFKAEFPGETPNGDWDAECFQSSADDLAEAIEALGWSAAWNIWHTHFHAQF